MTDAFATNTADLDLVSLFEGPPGDIRVPFSPLAS